MQEYDLRIQAAKHYAEYHGMDISDTFRSEHFLRLWNNYVDLAHGANRPISGGKGESKTSLKRNLGVTF